MQSNGLFPCKLRLSRGSRLITMPLLCVVAAIGWAVPSTWKKRRPPTCRTSKSRYKDLPCEHKMILTKDKAAILTLSDGKEVAFWCEGGNPLFGDTVLDARLGGKALSAT